MGVRVVSRPNATHNNRKANSLFLSLILSVVVPAATVAAPTPSAAPCRTNYIPEHNNRKQNHHHQQQWQHQSERQHCRRQYLFHPPTSPASSPHALTNHTINIITNAQQQLIHSLCVCVCLCVRHTRIHVQTALQNIRQHYGMGTMMCPSCNKQ